MREYMIEFKNFFNGEKRIVTLGDSRTEANKKYKIVRKNFSWWWRSSKIYC